MSIAYLYSQPMEAFQDDEKSHLKDCINCHQRTYPKNCKTKKDLDMNATSYN